MVDVAIEFDPLSADFFDDPYETYRRLRDEAPCYHSERYGFWALSRYDDVVVAHRNWQTFTSTKGITLDQLARRGHRLAGDGLDHLHGPAGPRTAAPHGEPGVHAEGRRGPRAHGAHAHHEVPGPARR